VLKIFIAHQSTLLGLRMANAGVPVDQFKVLARSAKSFSNLWPRIAGQRVYGVSDSLAEPL